MVNTDDFIQRLEIILDYYSLSASLFADKMGVQRSGLSHLMSGRNKPSLDFVMKIVDNFPEVDLYWLLNGDGSFPKKEHTESKTSQPVVTSLPIQKKESMLDLFDAVEEELPLENITSSDSKPEIKSSEDKKINRIVIFYKDGTFKNYNPEN